MGHSGKIIGALLLSSAFALPAFAENLAMVVGSTGNELATFETQIAEFEKQTGHHVEIVALPTSSTDQFGQTKLWLSAGNSDIDLYRVDVIWAPQLAEHFIDLTPYAADVAKEHFASIIESQTVNGKLVALPLFTDAPTLFYRKDLLEKYGAAVPKTWAEMADTARMIMEKERAAGDKDMWGFVFLGKADEGLTCNGLEFVASYGGGKIVEADGTISIDNPKAAEGLNMVRSWVGTISPEGVLDYGPEEARGVWQTGHAVFMRNWTYAYALGDLPDSAVKGKFDITLLPVGADGDKSAATLGGWNFAVSKYSRHPEAAVELAKFLTSKEQQKYVTLTNGYSPTIPALFDDPEIKEKQPFIPGRKEVLANALARPSAITGKKYPEVSQAFWSAVHTVLSGEGTAEDELAALQAKLEKLKGAGW